jgi:hypothetical protein
MKIVVFNLRYGANLWDRLIAECLAAELAGADPSFIVDTQDLGGRDAPQTGAGSEAAHGRALCVAGDAGACAATVAGMMLDRLVRRRLEYAGRRFSPMRMRSSSAAGAFSPTAI